MIGAGIFFSVFQRNLGLALDDHRDEIRTQQYLLGDTEINPKRYASPSVAGHDNHVHIFFLGTISNGIIRKNRTAE